MKDMTKDRRGNWVKSVLAEGEKPYLIIIEEPLKSEWMDRERYWIEQFRISGLGLTNTLDGGGESPSSNPEVARKISISLMGHKSWAKGKKFSKEHKAKISIAASESRLSIEHRRELSASRTGCKLSSEHKRKISVSLMGQKLSEENKAILLVWAKKRKTPEHRAKMSEAQRGHKVSQETRNKISMAKKGHKSHEPLDIQYGLWD